MLLWLFWRGGIGAFGVDESAFEVDGLRDELSQEMESAFGLEGKLVSSISKAILHTFWPRVLDV